MSLVSNLIANVQFVQDNIIDSNIEFNQIVVKIFSHCLEVYVQGKHGH